MQMAQPILLGKGGDPKNSKRSKGCESGDLEA